MKEQHVSLKKLTPWPILALALMVVVPSLLPACKGSSGNSDDNKGGDGGDGGNGGGNAGNGQGGDGTGGNSLGGNAGGGPGTDVKLEGACGPLPKAPIRRLSKIEYSGTLREVFPFIYKPDSDGVFRMDNHSIGFKRGTQQLGMSWKDDIVNDPQTFGFINRANNLNPTSYWAETTDDNAVVIAEYLTTGDALAQLLPCQDKTIDCGNKVIEKYGPRAFRRPMTDEEKKAYQDFFKEQFDGAKADDAAADNFIAAVRLTIAALLQDPALMYRFEVGDPATKKNGAIRLTQYEIANRLSYGIWSTMPDDELMTAAQKGELSTPDQLEKQARRMIQDKRFRFMVGEYFRQWLDLEKIFSEVYRVVPGRSLAAKDHSFTVWQALGARYDSYRFAEWVFADSDGTVEKLFTGTKAWVNKYTASVYEGNYLKPMGDGADPPDFAWKEIDLNPAQRSGILTRQFFGWAYSHFGFPIGTPNPPVRGNFVLQKAFCQSFPPPPADAQTRAGMAPIPAGATNREEFGARMAVDTICKACHSTLDPIGFAFEHYNEFGLYLTKDQKNPSKNIDASGKVALPAPTDIDGTFTDAIDLSKKLGKSKSVAACLTQQWYEYLTGRDADGTVAPEESDGVDACRIKKLVEAVNAKNGDLREAFIAFAKSPEFQWRPAY